MRLDLPIPDLLTALVAGGSVLLGVGVGAALIVRRGAHRRAGVYLGLFLLLGALSVLSEVISALELYRLSAHFWITPLLYTFALGPLLYGFVRTRLDPAWRPGRRLVLHAALPAYQVVHEVVTGFAPLAFKSWYWQTPYARLFGQVDAWVFALSFGLYAAAAYRHVRRAPESEPARPWLGHLLLGCAAILLVAVAVDAAYLLLQWGEPFDWLQLTEAVAYSAFLYWAAFTGWTHSLVPALPAPRRETYGIDAEALARHAEDLRRLVAEDRPYLDPGLTLPALADRLGVGDKELSYVLNEGLGTTYTDYVNGLRVEEAQRRLRDPAHAEAGVLEVGLASGFASKATFNRVFKRATGRTPSAFRAAHGRLMPS